MSAILDQVGDKAQKIRQFILELTRARNGMKISTFKIKKTHYVLLAIVAGIILTASMGTSSEKRISQTKIPSFPEGLHVNAVEDGVLATWKNSSGAESYTLFWGTEKGEYRRMFETTENVVLLKGLDPGHMYNFAVTASNSNYESSFSPEFFYVHDTDLENASDHVATAQDLMRNNLINEALAFVSAAIRLDNRHAEAYRVRASLLEKLGKREEARSDLLTAESLYNRKHMTPQN
ncbi:MAG: hypothetical protein AB7V04_11525 [Desulfomonilaceae bacterium]